MSNLFDVEDAWLSAHAEARQAFDEYVAEWFKPFVQTQIGLMVGTMGPRQLQHVDNGTLAGAEEILGYARPTTTTQEDVNQGTQAGTGRIQSAPAR